VLAGKKANEQLNIQFESEGLPPFITRFGIHVAEAVVGNLGSAERMEYTALRTAVNLASRLEGLNKQYGTTILVSEQV
jgi:adenylate cyclase